MPSKGVACANVKSAPLTTARKVNKWERKLSIKYQWIKFRNDVIFPTDDYRAGEWVLAEIETDCPSSAITLFGVEYTMSQGQVAEWGDLVPIPL